MTIVKRLIANYRSVIASLLVAWLLLCGMMPLMAVDMSMDMDMSDMVVSHGDHHGTSHSSSHSTSYSTSALEVSDEPKSGGADSHCCDAMADSVLLVQNQFVDLLLGLSVIAAICSFFFLWAMASERINRYYYSFIPPPGPPLRQRFCVWLD